MKDKRNHDRHRVGLILAFVGLISAATVVLGPARLAAAQVVGPSWSYTGSLNTARSGHTATLLDTGKVLVAGGYGNAALNSAELYDPATRTWSYTGPLNRAGGDTATLLRNGKVLVVGGNSAELYDPGTGTWSSTGNLSRGGGGKATLLQNGKVLVVGGNTAELYDPGTGTWSSTGNLNTTYCCGTATLLQNGKVLVVGGLSNDERNIAQLYDPATGTWSITSNLNTGSWWGHTATLLPNGKVLVTGGSSNGDDDFLDSAELYDPAIGTWSRTGDLNEERGGHTATLLPNGKVLVAGGFEYDYEGLNSAELYDPATGTWSITANLNTARVGSATLLLNGKVLVAGGYANGSLNTAELYDPGTEGSSTVQFSSASYTVGEGNPRVDITLSRSGDTTSNASIAFGTNDSAGLQDCNVINGTASPRCDLINTIGTLQFAAGETSKSFSVAIIDDSYAEGNEIFTVSLNNAAGASLGTQATATVTITDNESTNGPNPIDNPSVFVRQQYIDFLGREPDPPGFAAWVNGLNNCTPGDASCDRIHVSQQFFQSEEFQSRGYFVYRFYPVSFGRKPDYAEFTPDLARVSGFLDSNQLEAAKVQFIADFMARPAFAYQYNSLSNQQYVDTLINTAAVNLSNRQSMIDSLNAGTLTRAQVLRQIAQSTEVSTRYFNQAFAVMEYFGYLRRDPDAFYLDWIQVLDQGGSPRGMVTGFVNSTEYRQRFGP